MPTPTAPSPTRRRPDAIGWSHAYDNRGDAETVARRNCDSSANDCRIAIWFRNGCGAVAVGHRGGWGSGWGYDGREAQRQAIRSCRKQTGSCRVIRWQCSENE
ncbi:DUF4189 domain-containing protein [Rhizobium johnstonii]|uniref:DUF4189 domain-containing protein n=1 Tax=Rhizobium TaxID=379 RepID=UPI0017EBC93C|nr:MULTISPECIES: DUF4189 domain-containing protein [Rhizobium]WSG94231.1 DUF4189 domain-containing protein [Rhizobium johnstonii]MBB4504833.1 serine/threonine-protein kinase [Rhizobium leguminosarum]MCW1412313.1 DUF4189 domain-containing protein [Rhizobium acaciae]MCW1744479.1 DUF4189 domain-containing protein [Rhizobium acaciae]MCW1753125.1 DUF4189 domain-containing protein [Rhizobium acaciae]